MAKNRGEPRKMTHSSKTVGPNGKVVEIAGMCDTCGDDDHGNIVGDEVDVEMMIERAEVVWRLLLCL